MTTNGQTKFMRVTPETYDIVAYWAGRNGCTLAEQVEMIVDWWVAQQEEVRQGE